MSINPETDLNLSTSNIREIVRGVRDGLLGPHRMRAVAARVIARVEDPMAREDLMVLLIQMFEFGHASARRAEYNRRSARKVEQQHYHLREQGED
jgi:hypothetical protein